MSGPHKAIINIQFSVYPMLPTGELDGAIVPRKVLRDKGLKHKLLQVTGLTLEECLDNLKKKLEDLT